MSPTALSSFKAYVGIAADRINGMLTSAISAAATSLPLTNTNGTTGTISSAGSTYTATIVDGALTAATVCTGNFPSGAIACTATTNAHSAYAYVVFQLTASAGPTAYLPLETWTPDDVYEQLYDTDRKSTRLNSSHLVIS